MIGKVNKENIPLKSHSCYILGINGPLKARDLKSEKKNKRILWLTIVILIGLSIEIYKGTRKIKERFSCHIRPL